MPTTTQDFSTALATQVDREALQAAAEAQGTSSYGYVLQGIEGAQSSIGSLSTSTSTSLSSGASTLTSLSTSTSTSLSTTESAVTSLSTSTSTSLSTVASAIAVLNTIDTTPIVIVTTGQSNAVGQRDDGPNPADTNIKVWDGVTNAWGSSDIMQTPFSRSQPNGNLSKNSIGLAYAHRIRKETKRPVYLIHDAVGGKAIEEWMGAGTASVRYAALATKVVNALATPELAGVNEIDYLLWTQGEENYQNTFGEYLTKFTTLDAQFRAEAWMSKVTPMLVFGLANLHKRYEVVIAQEYYCANENPNCVYVNSSGLLTRTPDNVGDDTHFIGESLWEHGYYRAYNSLVGARQTYDAPTFFSRGTGAYDGGNVAIANFNTLVSLESANARFPFNSPLSNGSIMWGLNCAANGSYTFTGGARVATDSGTLYSFGYGDTVSFGANGDYSGGFGFQNVVNGRYGLVIGRGNTISDDGALYAGLFGIYTTAQADKVIFQHGNGTTSANRSNVIAARQSGIVELQGSKARFTPTAFYNYAASMTADTVGDIRTIKVGNELQVQNCTVGNVNQGAGTWVQTYSKDFIKRYTWTTTANQNWASGTSFILGETILAGSPTLSATIRDLPYLGVAVGGTPAAPNGTFSELGAPNGYFKMNNNVTKKLIIDLRFTMTAGSYQDFAIQLIKWNGTAWVNVPGATRKAWRSNDGITENSTNFLTFSVGAADDFNTSVFAFRFINQSGTTLVFPPQDVILTFAA